LKLIETRRRAGPLLGLLLGLATAAALVPVATCELWLGLTAPLEPGDLAPITVRLPDDGALRDPELSGRLGNGRILAVRNERLGADRAALVNEVHAHRPVGLAPSVGLGVAFGLIALLLSAYMRGSHRGRLLRRQATLLGTMVVFAVGVKVVLLLTPVSWFAMPAGAVSLCATVLVDRYAGIGIAVALGFILSALLPFDPAVAIVLGAQGLGAVLAFSRPKRRAAFLGAGAAGGCAAAAAYLATAYLYGGGLPFWELEDPARSPLLASLVGGLLSGPLALVLRGLIERIGGEIPRERLVELADLENPLLKKIAGEAPGTWQHSLAMANLAEVSANAIGANALLVRVGAYYHDLGKALQPPYYIENLGGQKSPHDEISPEMSADAIFAHVTEGVRLGRASGLPEGVIDFMHMHHGDGVLEYFWGKCQEQGNPNGLTIADFRYPGVKPQSPETAILAICDAVEAASRTLKRGDTRAIEQLVQRIVYGKLHLGQLDESGLTVAELKKLANTLVETLKHANHGRIEYPWQKEERAEAEARAATSSGPTPAVAMAARVQTGKIIETSGQFVLDSADAQRTPAPPPRREEPAPIDHPHVIPLTRRRTPPSSNQG
jgi:cyclic-di-AMP phosphodiesterase PgpH